MGDGGWKIEKSRVGGAEGKAEAQMPGLGSRSSWAGEARRHGNPQTGRLAPLKEGRSGGPGRNRSLRGEPNRQGGPRQGIGGDGTAAPPSAPLQVRKTKQPTRGVVGCRAGEGVELELSLRDRERHRSQASQALGGCGCESQGSTRTIPESALIGMGRNGRTLDIVGRAV